MTAASMVFGLEAVRRISGRAGAARREAA